MSPDLLKSTLCVVEDDPQINQSLSRLLSRDGYSVVSFSSASAFLEAWKQGTGTVCDLVVSDVAMPGASGYDLCRRVRETHSSQLLPIILITGTSPAEKASGIEAGADDFIQKPFAYEEVSAKIRSLLRIREQEVRTLGELQTTRESNVSLTRFLSPNVAHLVASSSGRALLTPHRADVTVMFVDLRSFTHFSECAEPEEVLEVLGNYYTTVGNAAIKHHGTLGHLAGDGIMIFFNDPEPVPNHQEVALRVALEVRETLSSQKRNWDEKEFGIGFGVGLAHGYATIGGIGFDQFWQYTVIGPVTNFAARLCQVAHSGQILVSSRFLARMRTAQAESESLGAVRLKGIEKPVLTHNVLSLTQARSAAIKRAA